MFKNLDSKSAVLLLAVVFGLMAGFSNFITGNAFSVGSLHFIDRGGNYVPPGDSPCERLGGEVFLIDDSKIIDGRQVELVRLTNEGVLVEVDSFRRAIEFGHKTYANGLFVTLYTTGTNEACLGFN